jgi:hypothetical protein
MRLSGEFVMKWRVAMTECLVLGSQRAAPIASHVLAKPELSASLWNAGDVAELSYVF